MALYLDTVLAGGKVSAAAAPRKCIKSESFDRVLLTLPPLAGFGVAMVVLANPGLFQLLLLADLWLLGYHHVVATYTRLAFSPVAVRQNRFLAVDLLLLIIVATLVLAFTAGAWVVVTSFLYLQWFHYMRQGYGLARMYFRATPEGQTPGSRDVVTDLVIYLVPIYCIASRSATMGSVFLELPVKTLVLPDLVIGTLGVAAALCVLVWGVRGVLSSMRGTLDTLYAGFVLSHVAMFFVAYIAIEDVNTGWLAINVWHNFQYVLVVWMMNAKRYAGGIDRAAMFLSRISQPGRLVTYFASCLAISTIVYFILWRLVLAIGGGIAITVGIYMGINFHHYIVDGLIWKRRRTVAHSA